MKLQIISLRGIEFEGEIVSLNLKTSSGEITVLKNHRPLITELAPGNATIVKSDGSKQSFTARSGFLEIGAGSVASLLLN